MLRATGSQKEDNEVALLKCHVVCPRVNSSGLWTSPLLGGKAMGSFVSAETWRGLISSDITLAIHAIAVHLLLHCKLFENKVEASILFSLRSAVNPWNNVV